MFIAVPLLLFMGMIAFNVSDQDWKGRVEKWFKEGSVKVDDRKDPVEGIDDYFDDLKDLVEFFSVTEDYDNIFFSKNVMKYFYQFQETELRKDCFSVTELIRYITIFVGVHQLKSTYVGLQLKVHRVVPDH